MPQRVNVIAVQTAVLLDQRSTFRTMALWTFVRAALRNPHRIGAVAPSSARLAALLASVVPIGGDPVVIELGPGTGAVTTAITPRLSRGARHIAVELDSDLAAFLRRQRAGVEVINGNARDLRELLAEREIHRAAAVISGLPWSLFDSESQQQILEQVAAVIGVDGVFTTFAYAHTTPLRSARNFRAALARTFADVQITQIVWQNAPPAFAYICRSPRLPLPHIATRA